MSDAFRASPLTVWVGPTRYDFQPGRDILVGFGQCDVPLDPPGNPAATSQPARPVLVLRFSGTHWVAIDRSPDGIFVDGARMSTVDIRDGQAITIGDPRRGPRLILGVGPAVAPPVPDTTNDASRRGADHPANATADFPASPAGPVGAADDPDPGTAARTAGSPTDRADQHHQAARHPSSTH